jgi:flagellar hook-basal body complex protein FliE
MAISFNSAVNAYNAAAQSVTRATGVEDQVAPREVNGASEFSNLVSESLQSAVQQGKQAETASIKAMTGEADLRDVVAAVNNAEVTLQTVMAIRDKVVDAYTQILRMPI